MRPLYPAMALMILLLCFLPSVQVVQAADDLRYLYQWKDDQGVVNMADDLDKVPPKYRSRTTRMLQPGAGKEELDREETRERSKPEHIDTGAARDQEEQQKAEWHQRMMDARGRLAETEERLQRAELEFKAFQEKHGAGLYGYTPSDQVELDRLNEEVRSAQKDREEARNIIENGIPEEARKSGVPPGWLRE